MNLIRFIHVFTKIGPRPFKHLFSIRFIGYLSDSSEDVTVKMKHFSTAHKLKRDNKYISQSDYVGIPWQLIGLITFCYEISFFINDHNEVLKQNGISRLMMRS